MNLKVELISEIHQQLKVKVTYDDSDSGNYYEAEVVLFNNTTNWSKELPEPIMDFVDAYLRMEF